MYVSLVQCVIAFGPQDVGSEYEDEFTEEQEEEVWLTALDSIRSHSLKDLKSPDPPKQKGMRRSHYNI